MTTDTLAAALEREHREIDAGIEDFLSSRAEGTDQTEPLRRAIAALRRHIYLEEAFLFPPLRSGGLTAPIFVMLREHGEIWDTMEIVEARMRQAGDGDRCEVSCRELLEQLEQHNYKEEAIIYPQADVVLSADDSAELQAFMAAGQMPPGWVCAEASA